MMFAVAGVLAAWILYLAGDWIWGFWGRPDSRVVTTGALLMAGTAAVIAWRNQQLFTLASEVTTELSKVTWPTRQETFHATVVVIVTTVIAAALLGIFDGTWAWVTGQIFKVH